MGAGYIISLALGVLSPAAMLGGCVFEALAYKMAKNPRCDKALLEKRRQISDVFLVAAWLLLAAAYLSFRGLCAGADDTLFKAVMTWILFVLLAADIYYLYLRRSRPRKPGQKKRFWER